MSYVHLEGVTLRSVALRFVVDRWQVSEADLLSRSKETMLLDGRAMLVWMLKAARPGMSYSIIGRWLDKRRPEVVMDMHMRAILLRMKDRRFKDICDDWIDHYRGHQERVRSWVVDPEFDAAAQIIDDLREQAREDV